MPDYRRLDRAIWRKNWIESAEIVEEVCETRNSKSKQNKKVQKIAQNSGRYDERNSEVGGAYSSKQDSQQNLCFSYGKLDFEKISTKFFRANQWIDFLDYRCFDWKIN